MKEQSKHLHILAISGLSLFPLVKQKGGIMGLYLGLKSFIDAGHSIDFLTCRPSLHYFYEEFENKKPMDYDESGIRVHEFRVPFLTYLKRARYIKLSNNRILHYTQYAFQVLCEYLVLFLFTVCAIRAGLKIARRAKPNVVYGFHIGSVAGRIVGKILGAPNINRQFGTFLFALLPTRLSKWRYFSDYISLTVPANYLIISNDGTKGDLVAKALKIPESRVKFWLDGVDSAMREKVDVDVNQLKTRLGIPADVPIVLSLGRLENVKGVYKLIRVIPRIIAQEENVLFLIVGEGSKMDYHVDLANQLGVNRWVRFTGGVAHQEVKWYMHVGELFVQLCDISNRTNVLLEALMCSRCIVTVDDGSTEDLITNGETGFLVPPDNDEYLADLIIKLIRNPAMRQRAGENAGQRAGKRLLTWDERGRMEIELVENLVYNEKSATKAQRH